MENKYYSSSRALLDLHSVVSTEDVMKSSSLASVKTLQIQIVCVYESFLNTKIGD